MKLVPLQENGKYDRELAYDKWGSKLEPLVDYMEYSEKDRTLWLDYESAWSPISEALNAIYEDHNNLIKSISTSYEEPGEGYWGKFYVDETGSKDDTFELPNMSIDEGNFKKLYELIRYKNNDVKLPEQIIENIHNSKDYNDFIKNISLNGDINLNNYNFDEMWNEYIYNNVYFELKEQLKESVQDFDEYVHTILIKNTRKTNK